MLKAFASEMDFEFHESGMRQGKSQALWSGIDGAVPNFWEVLSPFLHKGWMLWRIMTRVDPNGVGWALADFSYMKNSNANEYDRFGIVLVAHQKWNLPHFSLVPQGLGQRIGNMFTSEDLAIDSEPFSQKYNVRSSDKEATLEFLHSGMVSFLTGQPTYSWFCHGPYIMVEAAGTIQPSEFKALKRCVEDFLAQIPQEFVAQS